MGLHQRQGRGRGRFRCAGGLASRSAIRRASAWAATARNDPTTSTLLHSGDVLVMGGPARLAYHGVDRVLFGQGTLLPDGGRINLTLRVVASA